MILVVVVGGIWTWQDPAGVERLTGLRLAGGPNAGDAALKGLEARLSRLEQRPVPADTSGLAARVDALEKRAAAAPASVDLAPLQRRLDALEARVKELASVAPIAGVPSTTDAGTQAALSRLDALSARVEALAARDPVDALRTRLEDLDRQVSSLTSADTSLTEAVGRAHKLARLDAAAVALSMGQKLGPIADAPPALTRFANTAPPTEAALRLAFPAAARAALKVSVPDTEGKPFVDRMVARLQDFRLITVREGDHMLLGNPTADALAHAQVMLDAGDLAGAVKAVGSIPGPPAEKLAPWLADARALEAARAALASMAGAG